MYNNSLIFMTTTTEAEVLANGIVPLTTVQRRRSKAIQNSTNSVILAIPGYYKVTGSVTFTAPAAGVVSIKAQKNNADVPGLAASTTITTADTEVRTLNLNGVVRVYCNEDAAIITLVNDSIDITVQYLG